MDNERPPRVKRARHEDIVRLERKIQKLEAVLADKPPLDPQLPMTEEYFKGLCIIATIVSGGWNHLKFAHQRADEAWKKWQEICGFTPVEPPTAQV